MATTPEASSHTSAQKRIKEAQQTPTNTPAPYQPRTLMPFVGNPKQNMPQGLRFKLEDYLELLDWTGRILRDDKRGAIHHKLPPILSRLNIEPKNWIYSTQYFESSFKQFAGTADKIKNTCAKFGYQRIPKSGVLLT